MKRNFKVLGLWVVVFLLQACAHGVIDKQVDEKVAQEKGVNDRADLKAEAKQLIEKDTDLSSEQRTKLLSLRDATILKVDQIVGTSNKLKAVLIKDVMSDQYDDSEIRVIKERLRHLEIDRLAVLFGAMDEINSILGHKAGTHRWIADEFFEHGGSSFR